MNDIFYNILYLIFIVYVIIVKYKKLCTNCDDNRFEDIIKVLLVGGFAYHYIGSKHIIYTLLFALLVHIIVKVILLITNKILIIIKVKENNEQQKNCGYCHNPWNDILKK